jgi:hypothetical protein
MELPHSFRKLAQLFLLGLLDLFGETHSILFWFKCKLIVHFLKLLEEITGILVTPSCKCLRVKEFQPYGKEQSQQ